MNNLVKSALAPAALALLAGFGNAGFAQSRAGDRLPVPAIPPPIAAHSDPTAPVPTNPPEQIAPPAPIRFVAPARILTDIWAARASALLRAD